MPALLTGVSFDCSPCRSPRKGSSVSSHAADPLATTGALSALFSTRTSRDRGRPSPSLPEASAVSVCAETRFEPTEAPTRRAPPALSFELDAALSLRQPRSLWRAVPGNDSLVRGRSQAALSHIRFKGETLIMLSLTSPAYSSDRGRGQRWNESSLGRMCQRCCTKPVREEDRGARSKRSRGAKVRTRPCPLS